MIDHDQNFKELLSTFFLEFLHLFVPQIASTIDSNSVTFLQQEYFADLVEGEEKIVDLLVSVQQEGTDTTFLVHIETQANSQANFNQRMFFYFARLHQKHLQRIYPIVVFSFDEPKRAEKDAYSVEFPELKVLDFRFKSIQVNRLNWRDYLTQQNPVAIALMAKMRIAKEDRPKVKAECLRLLVTLRLDPAKTRLISRFVDTYLRLDSREEKIFEKEIDKMEVRQKEEIMEAMTSWEIKGMEKGMEKGIGVGQRSLLQRLLTRQLGALPDSAIAQIESLSLEQIEALSDALFDFRSLEDLMQWLNQHLA
jgi:predicted transposase/invertase (TIGR01784 family)